MEVHGMREDKVSWRTRLFLLLCDARFRRWWKNRLKFRIRLIYDKDAKAYAKYLKAERIENQKMFDALDEE